MVGPFKRREPKPTPSLGWREWVALPDLDISTIKAKLDTGARTSALHAVDIKTFRRRGRDMVRFTVHPVQRSSRRTRRCEAEVVDEREVRSSSGTLQRRLVIKTNLSVAGRCWPIEVTLASRDQMGFRLLLGRQALARRFLVDPGRSYLVRTVPRKRTLRERRRRP